MLFLLCTCGVCCSSRARTLLCICPVGTALWWYLLYSFLLCRPEGVLLRGTMVNRTYGTRKNLYIYRFYQQYLLLFTMVPRKYALARLTLCRRSSHKRSSTSVLVQQYIHSFLLCRPEGICSCPLDALSSLVMQSLPSVLVQQYDI